MYEYFNKRTLKEVAEELNEKKVDKDNIIYIRKGEHDVHYQVLYYAQDQTH